MSKSSKIVVVVLVLGLLTAYYFLVFIPHRDKKAADNFISAFERYKKANTTFIEPLNVSTLKGVELRRNTPLDDVIEKGKLAIANAGDNNLTASGYAGEAIAANNLLIRVIGESDRPQVDCKEAMLALNTSAASLRNPEMRKCATEICDLILKRHNNTILYKQALLERCEFTSEIMNIILENNNVKDKLSSFFVLNKDRVNKFIDIIENTDTDNIELTSKIDISFARFKGLACKKE